MVKSFALALILLFASQPLATQAATAQQPKAPTPAQVWKLVRDAYLARNFKAMYAHFSAEDKKKRTYKKFAKDIERDYDDKVGKFKMLKYKGGKTYEAEGKRYHRFDFMLGKKQFNGGRMLFEKGLWKLYRFH